MEFLAINKVTNLDVEKMGLVRYFLVVIMLSISSFSVAQADEWIETQIHDGVAYFLFDSPAHIKRYDLTNEVFIDEIVFNTVDAATAIEVDSDGLYVAFGRRISRYLLDGTGGTNLANTSSAISSVVTSSTTVYAYFDDSLISINKSTNQTNATQDYFYRMRGLSYSRVNERLFARNSGVSPSDILYIELNADGSLPPSFQGQNDSPYHGEYPNATQTYLYPDETKVVDDSGTVYATSNLTYLASLGGSFQDLTFYGDLPVMLRDGELISFSNTMLETGSYAYGIGLDVRRITVFGNNVFGFYLDSGLNLTAIKTELELLTPDVPGQPVDPVGLAYTPDSISVGDDGIVYILSKTHLSVFRWSLLQQGYLPTIPLINVPNFMAYSAENQALYIAYDNGTINRISLDVQFLEVGFVNLSQKPLGLATAGEYVFAVDPSGAWVSHFTYDPSGTLISQKEWNYQSQQFVWNAANRRMYHTRDGTSPNDLHWEEIGVDGVIGQKGDSPFHNSAGIKHPIRVEPNGSVVILGSGRIFDGLSLDQVNSLSNDIVDAVWNAGELFTLRDTNANTIFQQWNPLANYNLDSEKTVSGEPIALLQATIENEHWLSVVSSVQGIPVFRPVDMGDNLDIDGDLVENLLDNCLYIINPDQIDENGNGVGDACDDDLDDDGVNNDVDNCPSLPNPSQIDTDEDGMGDLCDEDDDNDLVNDAFDNCPKSANADQLNTDGDTEGDACDSDQDNDNVLNGGDIAPLNPQACEDSDFDLCDDCSIGTDGFGPAADNLPLSDGLDTNGDGICNVSDPDDDSDTVEDEEDNCPLIANPDQRDSNNNGVGDLCDVNDQMCLPIKTATGMVLICL